MTILYAGALLHALYRVPACRYHGLRVYTNTPPNGAMRGHGSVDVRHAFESLLDAMAGELGLDPFVVRRANLLGVPHRTINDLQVNSYGLPECLDRVEAASGWRERRGKLPRGQRTRHGVLALRKRGGQAGALDRRAACGGQRSSSTSTAASASSPARRTSGRDHRRCSRKTVAEVLGLRLERLRVVANDSVVTPKDNGSYSSRVSFMVGNAAIRAARELQKLLVEAAARKLAVAAARHRMPWRDLSLRGHRPRARLQGRRCRSARGRAAR